MESKSNNFDLIRLVAASQVAILHRFSPGYLCRGVLVSDVERPNLEKKRYFLRCVYLSYASHQCLIGNRFRRIDRRVLGGDVRHLYLGARFMDLG